MEVTASKRLGSMMLVAALILWMPIDGEAAYVSCEKNCTFKCFGIPLPFLCIPKCRRRCPKGSLTSSASEHCDVGCFLSTCLDYHPDTQKVGVDMKKVGACADSCSQGCQKAYPLN